MQSIIKQIILFAFLSWELKNCIIQNESIYAYKNIIVASLYSHSLVHISLQLF